MTAFKPMRCLRTLSRAMMAVAGGLYLLIALMITFDLLARRLLGFSSGATTELSGYLMAVGMSFGLAATLLERGHVRLDALARKLPRPMRCAARALRYAAMVVTAGFLTWCATKLTLDSARLGATDLSALLTPLALPQGLWACGFALFFVCALAVGLRALRRYGAPRASSRNASREASQDAA